MTRADHHVSLQEGSGGKDVGVEEGRFQFTLQIRACMPVVRLPRRNRIISEFAESRYVPRLLLLASRTGFPRGSIKNGCQLIPIDDDDDDDGNDDSDDEDENNDDRVDPARNVILARELI